MTEINEYKCKVCGDTGFIPTGFSPGSGYPNVRECGCKCSIDGVVEIVQVDQTDHQLRVEETMRAARQEVPKSPMIPSRDVRILRARLILEEAFETIHGLGFDTTNCGYYIGHASIRLIDRREGPVLKDIVDGCADLSVVTIGTLSACGVKDMEVLRLVDENNQLKMANCTFREDGKYIKPPGHVPPDFAGEIERQIRVYGSPSQPANV